MFDAAVASEAIDGALQARTAADSSFGRYVREEWSDYTNACWSANWFRLFSGSASDVRKGMGWPNRFANAIGNASQVFNYYSSGDSVFAEQNDIPSILSDSIHWGVDFFLWLVPYPTVEFAFENHGWQKQEVLKGMATVAGTLSGGWGFNVWQEYDAQSGEYKSVRYSPEGAVAAVISGTITNRPAFDVSDAAEMMNANASQDDIFLALAKHVPALSSPIGGIMLSRIMTEERDLNIGVPRPNGWGRSHPTFSSAWLHSDMKDMAYFYVFKLFDEIITKGDLK